ncbi:HIG1 domain family member 2A, mitochondrial [Apis mellifera caucasica]|uniref:HIG1 domain family member 2A, mitochondrial n=1 Tax=Apis mellifera TaxID=7460 RepID=A0A7M7LKR3_APIME|nr:HIG1 domain family member 2A, mitochondrial [Apis mellifera]KAG6800780.1 HIG1 domain family member 2A, mitochondrial [Apis mellifera caucasica]|eukprot:XP_001122466.1 HIG1 domain family member 2A, mitochondrial [Apis mellifera]
MSSYTSENSEELKELDWIRVQTKLNDDYKIESLKERMIRKVKENPIIPFGILATTSALSYGLYSFYMGNTKMSQLMMRTRVGAQSFTLLAILGGWLIIGKKNN